MTRTTLLLLLPLTVLACTLLPQPAEAQSSNLARYNGTYVPTKHKANAKAIESAITRTLKQLPLFFRPFAKGKLRETIVAFPRISIKCAKNKVTIHQQGAGFTVAPKTTLKTKNREGEPIKVRQICEPREVRQRIVGENGGRTMHYRLSKDNKSLAVHFALSSPRLETPIRYTLHYKRK